MNSIEQVQVGDRVRIRSGAGGRGRRVVQIREIRQEPYQPCIVADDDQGQRFFLRRRDLIGLA